LSHPRPRDELSPSYKEVSRVVGSLISPGSVIRSLVAAAILIAAGLLLGAVVGSGLGVFGVILWLLEIGIVAAGGLLLARGRPIAGIGAIVTAVSIVVAYQYTIPGAVWSVLFFVGVGLVAWGTRADVEHRHAWVVLIPRVFFGWAWVDNAQDHFRAGWLPGGAPYLQQATGAANRPATYFLDPLYQGFLKDVVVPNGDVWASLTMCGELVWGVLLALGLLTPVAAIGLLFQSFNYVNMKSFVAHGAYTDKSFFAAELFLLIVNAGLAYGLDASLRHHVPGWLATTLMGAAPDGEDGIVAQPAPTPA
jgi:thiosulfate dehydrogenase [quinone] large subunit